MTDILPLDSLAASRFDTPAVLRKLATASRQLAELKGIAASIPHQGILINALGIREAKDSSAIENIVTRCPSHSERRDESEPNRCANTARDSSRRSE